MPALGAAVLAVAAAAAYALMSWLADALGVLGAVRLPVAVLVPGALGFALTGYLLGRCRILQRGRRGARLPGGDPPAVIIAMPARRALSQAPRRRDLDNGTWDVPASERGEVRR